MASRRKRKKRNYLMRRYKRMIRIQQKRKKIVARIVAIATKMCFIQIEYMTFFLNASLEE